MSEIFSWLRRTEVARREALLSSAVENAVPAPDAEGRGYLSTVPVQEESRGTASTEIKGNASFETRSAHEAVRKVLDPLDPVGEQYRILRAKLAALQKESGLKTLLVTSSSAEEGKTFTACCLAGVFAQEPGKKVLLIDSDLRKPSVAAMFGLPAEAQAAGLVAVLRGEAKPLEVIVRSSGAEFYLMPAGAVPVNPAELLASPSLEQTLSEMAAIFDWIILDSPPVLAIADANLLMRVCDAALLVVRRGKTHAHMVQEAVKTIGKEKLCGLLMNMGPYGELARYYRRYYRHYEKSAPPARR